MSPSTTAAAPSGPASHANVVAIEVLSASRRAAVPDARRSTEGLTPESGPSPTTTRDEAGSRPSVGITTVSPTPALKFVAFRYSDT